MSLFKFGFGKKNSQTQPKDRDSVAETAPDETNKTEPGRSSETGPPSAKKARVVRNFNHRWLVEFKWLVYDTDSDSAENNMKCAVCMKNSKADNAFVRGSTNFQRSALTRHQDSDDHKLSNKSEKQAAALEQSINKAEAKVNQATSAMIRTALCMVQEEIPDRKFHSLLQMQVSIILYVIILIR